MTVFFYTSVMPSYLRDFFRHKHKGDRRKRYVRRVLITGRDRIYAQLYPVQLARFKEVSIH